MLYDFKNKTAEIEVVVDLETLHELPMAFKEAMSKYKTEGASQYDDIDVWNGEIRLIRLDFEINFRRSNFRAVFGICEGK